MKTYVISGGTGSGKTATINALKKAGCNITEEAARQILESMGKTPHEVERDFLQRKIFNMQVKQFSETDKNLNLVFFDRGFGDTLCFYLFDGLEIPKDLLEKAKKVRYDKIFFLEPLKVYRKDNIRCEDEDEARRIGDCAFKVYSEILGYEVIKVPFMSVKDRVRFIKERS